MIKLNIVSLSVNILIMMCLLIIILRSHWFTRASSHASANPIVANRQNRSYNTSWFLVEFSMIGGLWYLSTTNMLKSTCDDPPLFPLEEPSKYTTISDDSFSSELHFSISFRYFFRCSISVFILFWFLLYELCSWQLKVGCWIQPGYPFSYVRPM